MTIDPADHKNADANADDNSYYANHADHTDHVNFSSSSASYQELIIRTLPLANILVMIPDNIYDDH